MRTRRQAASTAEPSSEAESTRAPDSPAGSTAVVKADRRAKESQSPAPSPSPNGNGPKIPQALQFPLVVFMSFTLSALGYQATYSWTKAVLADHARMLDSLTEVALLTGWKVVELALGWYGEYDSYDLAALNLLSQGPPLYLLAAFYQTPASCLALSLTIDMLSTYIPFRLLRSLSPARADPAHAPNAELLTDKPIALLTSLLSGAIFTISLFAAYVTYLPGYLVVYLNKLPSLAAAHETSYVKLLPVTLPMGLAAASFIFTPAEAQEVPKPGEGEQFDPVNATLQETVWWNLWGWNNRTKTVMKRTATLALMTGVNTTLQTALTIEGAEVWGGVAWASVWVFASVVTGFALGAVGNE
jgi:hypothetical protein